LRLAGEIDIIRRPYPKSEKNQ